MDADYINEVIGDLKDEVKVKGSEIVADNLGVSEAAIRELCPNEANAFDQVAASA